MDVTPGLPLKFSVLHMKMTTDFLIFSKVYQATKCIQEEL